MKKTGIAFLLMVSLAYGALWTYNIKAPGIGGLVSNIDEGDSNEKIALKSQNTSVDEVAGRIERRFQLEALDAASTDATPATQLIYASHGFHSSYGNFSQVISVVGGLDSILTQATNLLTRSVYSFTNDELLRIGYSDPDSYNSTSNFVTGAIIPNNGEISFEETEYGLLISGKGMSPLLYSPYRGVKQTNAHEPDKFTYAPYAMSATIEAPGQLRVVVADKIPSNLSGTYRYTYGSRILSNFEQDLFCAPPSAWVDVDGGTPVLMNFECSPENRITTAIHEEFVDVYRQKLGEPWYLLGNFRNIADSFVYYVDEVADGGGTLQEKKYLDSGRKGYQMADYDAVVYNGQTWEGQFVGGLLSIEGDSAMADTNFIIPLDQGVRAPDSADFALGDYVYFFTWTYYDPVTGRESPYAKEGFGPVVEIGPSPYNADDTVNVAFNTTLINSTMRPNWIRLYRSEYVETDMASTIPSGELFPRGYVPAQYYCIGQVRVNDGYHYDVSQYDRTLFFGWGSDGDIVDGMHNFDTSTTNLWPIQNNDVAFDEEGAGIARPTQWKDYDVPSLSLVKYSSSRYWGIGDELFGSRLYYSAIDDESWWSALSYLGFNEYQDDELVSLEVAPGGAQDMLYAFKHNEIYSIVGYDAEYDLSYSLVSPSLGAINRYCTISTEYGVFFISMDLDLYTLAGGPPKLLSKGVESVMNDMFNTSPLSRDSVRMFRYEDNICIGSTALADTVLYFNMQTGLFGTNAYLSSYSPLYSFTYDTLETKGHEGTSYWLLEEAAADRFLKMKTEHPDQSGGVTSNCSFNYRTPFLSSDDGFFRQIYDVALKGYWVGDMNVRVISGDGDTLATTVLTRTNVATDGTTRFGFTPHASRRVCLDFSSVEGDSLWIGNIKINGRQVGNVSIQ